MIGRIVEIADDHRHLSLLRGFMVVSATDGERQELGRVPLDDISAVIGNAYGISYTNNLLVELAQRGAPFVLCAANHNAVGMLLPISGNYQQAKRFDAQIAASRPTRKRVWATIVRTKIQQQDAVLNATGVPAGSLAILKGKVRSGDPDNLEAQAARRYWGQLFGTEFRRDRELRGINALLNYGYTVLRASTARAVVAAGLHPTLGIHHSNEGNPMRLVDDLMEPFRPLIDLRVWRLTRDVVVDVTPEAKRAIVHTLHADMHTSVGATPVSVCIQRLATSLAQLYLGERETLDFPLTGLPLDLLG